MKCTPEKGRQKSKTFRKKYTVRNEPPNHESDSAIHMYTRAHVCGVCVCRRIPKRKRDAPQYEWDNSLTKQTDCRERALQRDRARARQTKDTKKCLCFSLPFSSRPKEGAIVVNESGIQCKASQTCEEREAQQEV